VHKVWNTLDINGSDTLSGKGTLFPTDYMKS